MDQKLEQDCVFLSFILVLNLICSPFAPTRMWNDQLTGRPINYVWKVLYKYTLQDPLHLVGFHLFHPRESQFLKRMDGGWSSDNFSCPLEYVSYLSV